MAFGKPLAQQGMIQRDIAVSRLDIDTNRLLVLKAAHVMDTHGNKVAPCHVTLLISWQLLINQSINQNISYWPKCQQTLQGPLEVSLLLMLVEVM